jgi:hypothetical protein
VHVLAPAISSEALTVYLSLNYLAAQNLQTGDTLTLKLMPERIKLF